MPKAKRTSADKNLDFIDPGTAELQKEKRFGRDAIVTPQERVRRLNYWIDGMKRAVPTGELIEGFLERFDVHNPQAALYWRNNALKYLSSTQAKDIESFKAVQCERLTDLYRRCLEARQFKTAQSVLDTLNKTMGVYKQDNVIIAPVTQFNFGDERVVRVENAEQVQQALDYLTLGEITDDEDAERDERAAEEY